MKKLASIMTVAASTAALMGIFWLMRVQGSFLETPDILAPLTRFEAIGYSIAYITSPAALLCIALLATFLAIESHHIHAWLQVVAGLIAVVSISWLIKELTQLPRPPGDLITAGFSQYSFPSTHAASAAFAGSLVAYHTQRLTRIPKHIIYALAGFCVLLVGHSRIILEVHTINDVLAGITLGLGVSLTAIILWPNWHQLLTELNEDQQLTG